MQNLKGTENMSGIFAYTGKESAKEILISGLSELKSRGKEISGIVLRDEESFISLKIKGSPSELEEKANQLENSSTTGIAECCCEGRCKASSITAPPVSNNLFAAALDGSIENFKGLLKWSKEPFPIASQEDLLLACLCILNGKNKIELTKKLYGMIVGAPSFVFMSNEENAIYCKSGKSKLIIGVSGSGLFVSSELGALLPLCDKYAVLETGESARLSDDRITVFDSKLKKIKKTFTPIKSQNSVISSFHMADEANCCSFAVKESYSNFVKNQQIDFNFLKLGARYLGRINKILLIGNASEKGVAMAARPLFETYCSLTSTALESAEFLLSKAPVDKDTLVIAISKSGENKTTVEAVYKAKEFGAKVLALTKNRYSALARECDFLIAPKDSIESDSSSPFCFVYDYITLSLFSLYLGYKMNIVSELYIGVSVKMAELLSGILSAIEKPNFGVESFAKALKGSKNVYVCSAGADYSLSFEAAQLMRSANINALPLSPSELCEIPKELLASSVVFAIITESECLHCALENLQTAKNRGANVIVITSESIKQEIYGFESVISFNDSLPVFGPLPCITAIYKITNSL